MVEKCEGVSTFLKVRYPKAAYDMHLCVVFMWPLNGHINTTQECISNIID